MMMTSFDSLSSTEQHTNSIFVEPLFETAAFENEYLVGLMVQLVRSQLLLIVELMLDTTL